MTPHKSPSPRKALSSALRSVLLSFALTAVLLIGGGCQPFRTPTITVMTYSIHHGAGGDGTLDLKRIAAAIKRANPDLIALQEVDRKTNRSGGVDQAKQLAELTGMHAEYGPAMSADDGEYGNAVLSRYEIKSKRVHTLPYQPGRAREPRAALEVRVEPTDDSGEIAFISTHFDQTGGDGESERVAQAKALASLLADDAETPTILAGNFNCEPGSEPLEVFRKSWTDATAKADFLTSPAIVPEKKIDLVFVKPETRWKVKSAEAIKEVIASDHRPVKVVLELQPKSKKPKP
jgi:endonuclease/exonuclease/phosphatase family metal-dependent hydrolase